MFLLKHKFKITMPSTVIIALFDLWFYFPSFIMKILPDYLSYNKMKSNAFYEQLVGPIA